MNTYETPLVELLKTVPKDARFVEEEEFSSTYHPVGRLCHEAADRIAELEKQSEPVVWMSPDGKVSTTEGMLFHIPLYTTPQTKPAHDFNTLTLDTGEKRSLKPLSDEEILEMTIWNKNLYELYVEMEKEDMIAFARAIEERHGIK